MREMETGVQCSTKYEKRNKSLLISGIYWMHIFVHGEFAIYKASMCENHYV